MITGRVALGRRSAAIVLPFVFMTTVAQAQSLSISGDRFAIDGAPRFLTFISYFGAMNAANVMADLQYIQSKGFDGVRIWPNLNSGPLQLMQSDGALSSEGLARLLFILDRAHELRLVVDVSFTAEHVPGLDARHFRDGILAATGELKRYDNLLFDIQNERNVYGPYGLPLSGDDVASIRAGIKSIHPGRIVTASNSSQNTAAFAADFAAQTGLDVVAYHDPRTSHFYEAEWMRSVVGALRANGLPAYLQEPMPTRYPFYPVSYRTDAYQQQMVNAKLAGAAAWCFHTELSGQVRDALYQNLIESEPEPERAFVNALIPRVNLRTSNGASYVSAQGAGGSEVSALAIAAGPWEAFRVVVPAGGPPIDGDRVAFRSFDDIHYLQAVGGGGGSVRAVGTSVGPWEIFVLEKGDGGAIKQGDPVKVRASGAPWYMTAESGGGGPVNINRASPGLWETFTILFVP